MSQQSQQELASAIVTNYKATLKPTLQALSKKYNLHPRTVRKHLVTAGVYNTPKANLVLSALRAVLEQSVPSDQIVTAVEKNLAKRNAAVERIVDFESLWDAIILFEGYPFYTTKMLSFMYKIRGNEIFVDRKEKSITRATVALAYKKTVDMGGDVTGPKKLGCLVQAIYTRFLLNLG